VLFHLALAAMLLFLTRRQLLAGNRLKFYLIGYFAFRFLAGFIRPEPHVLLNLTFYQWASLVGSVFLSGQLLLPGWDSSSISRAPEVSLVRES
jgi:prolipoprotein diacylglyceryltransferase